MKQQSFNELCKYNFLLLDSWIEIVFYNILIFVLFILFKIDSNIGFANLRYVFK